MTNLGSRFKLKTTCIDPPVGKYLHDYQAGWLKDAIPRAQRISRQVEAHLQQCRCCAADYRLWVGFKQIYEEAPHLWPDPHTPIRRSPWTAGWTARLMLTAAASLLIAVLVISGEYRYKETQYQRQLMQLADVRPAPSDVRGGGDDRAHLYNEAIEAYRRQNYTEADRKFAQVIQQNPDHTLAYYFQGSARLMLGAYPESVAAFEAYLARPGDAQYLQENAQWYLAQASLQAHDPEKAMRALSKIIENNGARKSAAERLLSKIQSIPRP